MGTSFHPPRICITARTAFTRASSGPARELSEARLRLAKQALDSAEMAYGAATEDEVRDRAYIAIRYAEAAEAEATAALASQRREKALRELASMGGERAARARAMLREAEEQTFRARQRADSAEQQVASEQARADQGAREAAQAKERLTAEQQARAEAETRTRQALADLEQLGNVRREARGLVVTLSGQVLFATNKAALLPASESSLDSVATALKALPPESPPVIIEGHTDSTGPRGYNIQLSERRAQAVRDYLVNKAVPSQRFTVRGLGPDRPVANNTSPEGRANNRRVEIVIPPPVVTEAPGAAPAALGMQPGTPTPGSTAPRPATTTSSTSTTTTSTTTAPTPARPAMTAPPTTTPGSTLPGPTPPPAPSRLPSTTPPTNVPAGPEPIPDLLPPPSPDETRTPSTSPLDTTPPSPGTAAPRSTPPGTARPPSPGTSTTPLARVSRRRARGIPRGHPAGAPVGHRHAAPPRAGPPADAGPPRPARPAGAAPGPAAPTPAPRPRAARPRQQLPVSSQER